VVTGGDVGLLAALFLVAALLVASVLLANRLHERRDARRALLERDAERMLAQPPPGLGEGERRVLLAHWVRVLPGLEEAAAEQVRAALRRSGLLDPVAARLRHRSSPRRAEACRILGRLGGTEVVPLLVERLGDRDAEVRRDAIGALADLRAVEALGDMARAIEATGDWNNLLTTMRLVRLGPAAVPGLGALLASSASPGMIKAVLQVTSRLGTAADPARVRALAVHPDPEVRVEALRTLGTIPPEGESVAVCLAAMDDAEWPARALAAWSLGRLGDARVAERLERAMGDPAYWVRHHVAAALSALGAPGDAALRRALEDTNPFVRDMAAQALYLRSATGREAA
jgi:HEAT repeat protein